MQISNLRHVDDFATIIADRCWHQWWTKTDVSLLDYSAGIKQMTVKSGIPIALVAHRASQFMGSVLLIENDLAARPQYSPWIAALWVEPEFRCLGIAGELIKAARKEASQQGFRTCYLCATDANSLYYLARGFAPVENNVSGRNIFMIES